MDLNLPAPSHLSNPLTMPYSTRGRYASGRRTNRRGARRRPGRAWYQKKYSAYELAGKAWTTAKYLKGLINVEFGKFDTQFDNATMPATGGVVNLTSVAQGDNTTDRHGLSVRAKRITFQGRCDPPAIQPPTDDFSEIAMVCLVVDKQQEPDNTPTFTDIFEAPHTPYSMPSISQTGRFRILAKQTVSFPLVNRTPVLVNLSASLNFKTRWNGPSASDAQKNGIYLVYISQPSSMGDECVLNGTTRFEYTDN